MAAVFSKFESFSRKSVRNHCVRSLIKSHLFLKAPSFSLSQEGRFASCDGSCLKCCTRGGQCNKNTLHHSAMHCNSSATNTSWKLLLSSKKTERCGVLLQKYPIMSFSLFTCDFGSSLLMQLSAMWDMASRFFRLFLTS